MKRKKKEGRKIEELEYSGREHSASKKNSVCFMNEVFASLKSKRQTPKPL